MFVEQSVLSVFLFLLIVVSATTYGGSLPFSLGRGPPGLIVGTVVGTSDACGALFLGLANEGRVKRVGKTAMRMHVGNSLDRALHPSPRDDSGKHFCVGDTFRPNSIIHVSTVASSNRRRT